MVYTSKEFSEKLSENGCDLVSDRVRLLRSEEIDEDFVMIKQIRYHRPSKQVEYTWVDDRWLWRFSPETIDWLERKAYSYDILNDICVKYAKEFFGEQYINMWSLETWHWHKYLRHVTPIFHYIHEWLFEKAEEYIRENCLFNPSNKKWGIK